VLIINKTDLLGLSDFNLERAKKNAFSINAELETFEIIIGLWLWINDAIRISVFYNS